MNISWDIALHENVSSTQDLIKEKARNGAAEGAYVQAAMQSAGRGRHGRAWVSQAGNLFFSLLLRPGCAPQKTGQLSLLIGAAIGKAIMAQGIEGLRLKWPNDILIGSRKCAGILIETDMDAQGNLDWVVVGCGINIVSAPDEAATFLNAHAKRDVEMDGLRDEILSTINAFYALWQRAGFAPIKEIWSAMAHQKGDKVQVRLGSRKIIGAYEGIDEQGALLLVNSETGKPQVITAGDVYVEEDI